MAIFIKQCPQEYIWWAFRYKKIHEIIIKFKISIERLLKIENITESTAVILKNRLYKIFIVTITKFNRTIITVINIKTFIINTRSTVTIEIENKIIIKSGKREKLVNWGKRSIGV